MVMKKYLPFSMDSVPVAALRDANPLTLSFVGDGVHTLFVRAAVLERNPYKNNVLHELASSYVCASAQAEDAKKLFPLLNEAERFIFNKAKNAKINAVPKHAGIYRYQLATAFEAVTGYLYLSGQNDRLTELYENIYSDKFPETQVSDTENEKKDEEV